MLEILFVPTERERLLEIGRPVTLDLQSAPRRDHFVRRNQPKDAGPQSLIAGEMLEGEKFGDHSLVRRFRRRRTLEDGGQFGCEDQLLIIPMIEERLIAQPVAGAKRLASRH